MLGIYWDDDNPLPIERTASTALQDQASPGVLHDYRLAYQQDDCRAINDCRLATTVDDCRITYLQDCSAQAVRSSVATCDVDIFHPHPLLKTFALDAEHVVACVPSFSSVVVLNRAAQALLRRLPGALAAFSPSERTALTRLAAMGLLNDGTAYVPKPSEPQTLSVWMHVTNACNLRCTYCYIHKSNAAMAPDVARASVDAAIRSARRNGFRGIALKYAGGEPTLRLDTVELIHTYAQERAARYGLSLSAGILSNGTLLTAERIAVIRRLNLGLMISLDGLAAVHDRNRPTLAGRPSADATLAGIMQAQDAGIPLNINVTVTGANVGQLPELVRWLIDQNLHFTLSFYRENDCSSSPDALRLDEERLINGMRRVYAEIARRPPPWSLLSALLDRVDLSQPHAYPCAAGNSYLVIDHEGRIAKCQMTIAEPVTHITAPDPLAVIRLDPTGPRAISVDERSGCKQCEWRYWCAGGCPVATVRATGRSDVQSPNCNIYRALYPDLLRLEGQRLLYWRNHV